MTKPIELSTSQRNLLAGIADHTRYSRTLRSRARAILLAADGLNVTRISHRARLDERSVRSVMTAWSGAAKDIGVAEHFGSDLLRRKIEMILTDIDQSGGCCDCEDDADDVDLSALNEDDFRELAQRVYRLLRHELRVERDRLPG